MAGGAMQTQRLEQLRAEIQAIEGRGSGQVAGAEVGGVGCVYLAQVFDRVLRRHGNRVSAAARTRTVLMNPSVRRANSS